MAAKCHFNLPDSPLLPNEAFPTESLLREILALAHESWSLDFLFKLDAASDVGPLTSPGQLLHSIIVDTNETMFETAGQYGGFFNMDLYCRWLVVPVAVIGDLTLEVAVQPASRTTNDALAPCRGIATIIRMLRSNATGTVVSTLDNPEANEISVTIFHNETKANRKRVFIRARRDVFLEALWDPQGINYAKMARSLLLTDVTLESYRCPDCAVSIPGLGCFCPVEMKKPAHPLDFATSRMNVMCHGGRFSGSCDISVMADGVVSVTATLASTIDIQTCEEMGLVQRLADMGIRSKMHANAVVPRALASPALDGRGGLPFDVPKGSAGFRSPISSFDGFDAFSGRNGLFGDAFGSTLGSSATSSAGVVEDYPAAPDAGVLQIEAAPASKARAIAAGHVNRALVAATEIVDRKLRRQLKNREAAARSNARRKQRNEALKKNLSAIRKKKCELEVRESELKVENARLLKLVNS